MSYEHFLRYAECTADEFWKDVFRSAANKNFQHGVWYKPSEHAITFQEDTKNKSSRIYLDLNGLDDKTATKRIIELHQEVIKCFSPTDKANRKNAITEMIERHETAEYKSWSDVKTIIERGSLINDYVTRNFPEFDRQRLKNAIHEINFALDIGTLSPESFILKDNKIISIKDMKVKKGKFKFLVEPSIKASGKLNETSKLTNSIYKYVEGL